jgi:pyruvate/2-oxoglutarate/acetoin dehydrogenase E1 component
MAERKFPPYMRDTVDAYRATGRIVTVHTRKRTVSLNGHAAISYEQAYEQMRACLGRTNCPRCGSPQHDANECIGLA